MYFFSRKLFFFDHHAIQGENPKVSKRPACANISVQVHSCAYFLRVEEHCTMCVPVFSLYFRVNLPKYRRLSLRIDVVFEILSIMYITST